MRDVRIVAVGPFGEAVADELSGLLAMAGCTATVARERCGELLAEFLAGGDFGVRASWRDVPAELDEFAAAAMAARKPWLPVAYTHPAVRVGPTFVPGAAPCHSCYRARTRQHADAAGTADEEVEEALATDRNLGVGGYPPHVAAIAAGLALDMLNATSGIPGMAGVGKVTFIGCATDAIQSWQVTPAHGCPVCDPVTDQEALAKVRRDRLRVLGTLAASGFPGGCG